MLANVNIRRKYFINKAFQLNLILKFVILVIFGSIISGLILYFYMARKLLDGPEVVYYNTMGLLAPAIIFTQFIVGVFVVLIAIRVVLLISHRIAGPLYRLERVAERVGDGDLTVKIGFRDKDALLPFKSSFQKMIDNMQFRMLRFRDRVEELKHIDKELAENIANSSLSQAEKDKIVSFIKKCISLSDETLNEFKLP